MEQAALPTKTITEQANALLEKIEKDLNAVKSIADKNKEIMLIYNEIDKDVVIEISKIKGTSLTEPTKFYDTQYTTWVFSGQNSVCVRSKKYKVETKIVE